MTRKHWIVAGAGVVVTGAVVMAWMRSPGSTRAAHTVEPAVYAEVEHVYSGSRVKLDSGEKLVYAGIRGLRLDEPLGVEATQRNIKFVEGEDVRLRFDTRREDAKGNLVAYVVSDCGLVNEQLVREGLAYVQLTPDTLRFADRLLAAQEEAIAAHRGVWGQSKPTRVKGGYHADPKYGLFHLDSCVETPKIREERRVTFKKRMEAVRSGFAPCDKCNP